MAQQGWIKIHRKLKECYIWLDKEPFDKRSAWIDLILSANHADNKTLINNQVVLVKRGTFITSEVKLAERWKWDRGKVRRFLSLLEQDNMIQKTVTSRLYITVEIINYNTYQDKENTTSESVENTEVEYIDTTREEQETDKSRTSDKQVTNINKNDKECTKNDKNEKNLYIPFEEIVNYLNEKAGTNYKSSSSKTKELIKARTNEKFTLENFKTVIDKKCQEWRGTEQEKYLRPETLFGTKFESYLNQKIQQGTKEKQKNGFHNYKGREYDFDDLEKKLTSWEENY